MNWEIIYLLIGLAAGAGIAYLALRPAYRTAAAEIERQQAQLAETTARYEAALAEREAALAASRDTTAVLIREKAEALTRGEALEEKLRTQRAEQEELEARFRAEFRNLAAEIFEEKSRQFKETNRESLEGLLKPFRDNIKDFRERVELIYKTENEQHGALRNEIGRLAELNRRITEETTNLTNALKGNSKVQGDWGEMILETILESSNLSRGIHYLIQENLKDEAGNNLRPDVILRLPDQKQIVIDSKVSVKAFVNYTACEDPSERQRLLSEHLRSVRAHVEELGRKSYQKLLDSPDFVIMFIPNEPAFLTALQNDSAIWTDAYNRKVIISSPTNLFALLKIVDDLWKRDSQNRNALAIAEQGAALYDKFVGFAETLGAVGKNIEAAHTNYDKAMSQLKTGKGNLVSRTERLRELGVKASKTLPAQLSDFDDADSDEPLLPGE
ncbi:MAG: DNA recombination protein RmuC [Rikenellaceae bacterium]|nr:DNA recombination protein RmuC [Rikenellaceae bacterium]